MGVSTTSLEISSWFTSLTSIIASLVLVTTSGIGVDDVDPTLRLPAKEAK